MSEQEFRIEHDTMGEVQVPVNALWRAQTQRAVENFPISGRALESAQIRAMGLLKAACAQVNKDSGALDAAKADAIIAAGQAIAAGDYDDEFPIDVFQTGSGTSSNMNTNEVIASLAKQDGVDIHPNDDVNMGQSSNDTFPTATHVAATEAAVTDLIPGLKTLQSSLAAKSTEWESEVKSGRTHLMDAVPVTLGQEFSGYARQIELGIQRVEATLPRLGELAIGGTATGTGLNTSADFGGKVTEELKKLTGVQELAEAENHFEAQAARDALVEFSGAMRTIAVSLNKIANDIRMMGSGPLTGFGEIRLPDLQPGSSIMPGKVNPVLCETATQVAAQVVGNDAAIAFGGAQGHFELNVFIPMMARNVLESAKLLANTSRVFAERLVDGIEPNTERMSTLAKSSPSIVTPVELRNRVRSSGQGRQDRARRGQDDPSDGHRSRIRPRQALRGRVGRAPRRAGHGQHRSGLSLPRCLPRAHVRTMCRYAVRGSTT
jgi:fumarate hydratase class II